MILRGHSDGRLTGRGWFRHSTVWACGLLLFGVTPVWADPLSIKEFHDKLEAWKTSDKDPSALTLEVEGRVKLYAKERLTFDKCRVKFISKTELPERVNREQNVVVVGKVTRDPKTREYTFHISSLRLVPNENDQFLEKRRQIKQPHPEEWYALGRWAQSRGEFYNDDRLLNHGQESMRRGLELERKALGKTDPDGMRKLAAKARQFGVTRYEEELIHESYRLEIESLRDATGAQIEKLAGALSESLPGTLDQVPDISAKLIADYQSRPFETFAAADMKTRRQLNRWLYTELQLRRIRPTLSADGRNGLEVAATIDREIPERHAVAEEIRDRALRALAATVETLSRTQVLELAKQYRLRNQERAAADVLESWLQLRKKSLDPDDTEGLINLSDDYRQLLKRADLADRLLLEGWAEQPKARDIQERLTQNGYRLVDSQWISEKDFNSRPEGRLEKAIREGLVEPGMTAIQVRRSRGQPQSQARSITAGQITEVWTYKFADSSQILVRFVKRPGQAEMTVVDVLGEKNPEPGR
ncbi:MAG: hypothetical protein JSS02_11925 [Planctomycetes bacterium]|nr:hypothetical protein [Planctomycetota bacterium]